MSTGAGQEALRDYIRTEGTDKRLEQMNRWAPRPPFGGAGYGAPRDHT